MKRFRQKSSAQPRGVTTTPSRSALRGVYLCITSLSPQRKERLHEVVIRLGGRYSGVLDTSHTSHLIASEPVGPKYEAAVESGKIWIVLPSWLEECERLGTRASEEAHLLNEEASVELSVPVSSDPLNGLSPSERCLSVLKGAESSPVFAACSFYLMGLDSELFPLVCKVLRRGTGTRYWELNEEISHVVIADECEQDILKSAESLKAHLPNSPHIVNPNWLTASLIRKTLQSPHRFLPKPKSKLPLKRKGSSSELTLFQGAIFHIIQSSSSESSLAKFPIPVIEESIKGNGGCLLTNQIANHLRKSHPQEEERVCYLVFLSQHDPDYCHTDEMISSISPYCSIIPVTHIWIQACIKDNFDTAPELFPMLFQPRSFPLHLYTSSKTLYISITGFIGAQRAGIVFLLQTMGLQYSESLKKNFTTHLICQERKGVKYDRALDWDIAVVGLEWLYYIMEFGLERKDQDATATVSLEPNKHDSAHSSSLDDNLPDCNVESTRLSAVHEDRLKSSLLLLKSPLANKSRNNPPNRKKRPFILQKRQAASSRFKEESQPKDDSSVEDDPHHQDPHDVQPSNDNESIGPLVESQAVWFAEKTQNEYLI